MARTGLEEVSVMVKVTVRFLILYLVCNAMQSLFFCIDDA